MGDNIETAITASTNRPATRFAQRKPMDRFRT